MWQSGNVALGQTEKATGFNRFSHYRARWIWKRHEKFVPLHCQNEGVETAVIKGENCEN